MSEISKLAATKVTRECALCGLVTEEAIVVCPQDGSALITHKPDPLIGSVIGGKFEILSLVGSGGMGNVYKAVQQPVGRHVALKVLHSEKMRNQSSVKRFEQEAKAASVLSHANIVGFFDYGLTEDNVPYIVMDFVEGKSIDETIRDEGVMHVERCISLFSQACDALEHAHQKGIIHRDIKPSNLMLTRREDGSETVKILDFGIAKLLPNGDDSNRANLTQTGELFGSPQYMSPEQCAGSELDARSDMYSLGCVMYEALMGQPPLRGNSLVDTIYKHTNEKPASFKTVRPDLDVPEQLEHLVLKTLEKEPAMRFPSMAVLKRNLDFVPVFAEKAKTMPPDKVADGEGASTKMTTITIVATLVVVAVTALCVALLDQNPNSYKYWWYGKASAQIAIFEAMNGNGDPRLLQPSRVLRDNLTQAGKNSDALAYAERAAALSGRYSPVTIEHADDLLAAAAILTTQQDARSREYVLKARDVLRQVATEARKKETWTQALALDKRVLAIDTQLNEMDNNVGLQDQLLTAEDARLGGSIDQAAPIYDSLAAKQKKLNEQQQRVLFAALNAVAGELAVRGQTDKAETDYKTAISLGTKLYGIGGVRVLETKRALGLFYQKNSRFTSAEQTLQDALAEANEKLGPTNDVSIALIDDLAALYMDMKELKNAEDMQKLAQTLKAQRPTLRTN